MKVKPGIKLQSGYKGQLPIIMSTSGGAASATALIKLVKRYGREGVVSVFCDTKTEDADLYRFLDDVDNYLGIKTVKLADGRNIWEVAHHHRMIPNTLYDICSKKLKREVFYKWIRRKYFGVGMRIALGFCAEEYHRAQRLAEFYAREGKHSCLFPLLDTPEMFAHDCREYITSIGLKLPRLYAYGFDHNNCGGFCFKAGMASLYRLWQQLPERYDWHMEQEAALRAKYNLEGRGFIKRRRYGMVEYISLTEFKEAILTGDIDMKDTGTPCDCFGVDTL